MTHTNTFLAVGRHCWGRGSTVTGAVRVARKKHVEPHLYPDDLLSVYRVDPRAYVDRTNHSIVTPPGGIDPEFIKSVPLLLQEVVR